jgi:hypothetical protein
MMGAQRREDDSIVSKRYGGCATKVETVTVMPAFVRLIEA